MVTGPPPGRFLLTALQLRERWGADAVDPLTQINGVCAVSAKNEDRKSAELEKANVQLTVSLERCRMLLSQCREQLAANSNAVEGRFEDSESRTA